MKRVPALAEALDRIRRTHHRQRPVIPTRRPMSDHELALAIREFRREALVGGAKWRLSTSTGQAPLQKAQQSSGAPIGPMADSDPEEFRKQADECRQLALEARSEFDRGSWLRLADNWAELAEAAESRRGI